MKKTGISFLALAFVTFITLPLQAQPSVHFIAPTTTIAPSNYFTAPIRVAGFNRIVGAQFSMNWNPSVLRFDAILNPALNMTINENFGLSSTESGLLTFSWYDPTLVGMSLPDSASLYTIRFEVLGASGTSSPITFGNMPTAKEVVDTSFTAIAAGFHDGAITIQSPSSASETEPAPSVQIGECVPNPVVESTTFSIQLREAVRLEWAVFDPHGRKLFSRASRFGAGAHILELDAGMLQEPGTYYCRFYLDDGSYISRKLIKI